MPCVQYPAATIVAYESLCRSKKRAAYNSTRERDQCIQVGGCLVNICCRYNDVFVLSGHMQGQTLASINITILSQINRNKKEKLHCDEKFVNARNKPERHGVFAWNLTRGIRCDEVSTWSAAKPPTACNTSLEGWASAEAGKDKDERLQHFNLFCSF